MSSELVAVADGQLMTTTLLVAENFGKRHDDVLKAIRNLECSENFNRRNFADVGYIDQKGERRPMFRITRDGFSFLAMGFTGKEAAMWKEAFIEAFNRMDEALRGPVNYRAISEQGLFPECGTHDAEFLAFLALTRGRMMTSPNGKRHDTVSINTAKVLQWLWHRYPDDGRQAVSRSHIGRELGIHHTTVLRCMRRLAAWGFIEEQSDGTSVRCRLYRDRIGLELANHGGTAFLISGTADPRRSLAAGVH